MLQALIQNTKPEIILSISDEYLDSCGNDTPARFVNITWQWHDDKGNWASIDVLGAIEDAPDDNFDLNTFTYGQSLTASRMADNDNWHSDWGMEISIPDGVDCTADDVGKAMLTIMHRLTLARIEYT